MTSSIKSDSTTMPIGKKIERIRVYMGVKQDVLATDLGISQQAVSNIEQQEDIEDDLLIRIANILGVTPELIKNFDEDKTIYYINNIQNNTNTVTENTFEETSTIIGLVGQQFNPIEKIVELYERLLKSEREKIDLLSSNKK